MRWFKVGHEPFASKGRGRCLIISDFLVAHPSSSFFYLNEEEWKKAIQKYPSLLENHGINYEERTCIGSIIPGTDGYFCSDTILKQFERLFQMLEFKDEYNHPVKHDIEIVVDSARTHTARTLNINDYRLHPGGNCPIEYLEWTDESGNKQTHDLFIRTGPKKGLSKGLRIIAEELGFELPTKLHPAFSSTTKLEALGKNYNRKIIFNPKFHCETNPIDGKWCFEKSFVRKYSDQTFPTMCTLIKQARIYFEKNNFSRKLIKRFWNVLFAYKAGATYGEVLKTYFGGKCKENITNHRKFYETFLKLP